MIQVSILMVTYNHENFIDKAIEGVLKQESNFKFELVICDDASSDGTGDVIKRYIKKHEKGKLIKYYRNKNNSGAIKNFNFGLEKCEGEFIATCEGDDFWTDKHKLQRQVDFLAGNNSYSICWTNYSILENGGLKDPEWVRMYEDKDIIPVTFENFSRPYNTYTLTSMFRCKSIDIKKIKRIKYFKDNVLYAMCLSNGKGVVLNFNSATYRIHSKGIYSIATNYSQALSNYICYSEILTVFKKSRVPNIVNKRNSWKNQFLRELNKRPFPKVKKWMIRYKLEAYFKWLALKVKK